MLKDQSKLVHIHNNKYHLFSLNRSLFSHCVNTDCLLLFLLRKEIVFQKKFKKRIDLPRKRKRSKLIEGYHDLSSLTDRSPP